MGAAVSQQTGGLPEGFILDAPSGRTQSALPEGFVLDSPPAKPPYDPRFPISADENLHLLKDHKWVGPPPTEATGHPISGIKILDRNGLGGLVSDGTATGGGMANPKREAELNALYGEPSAASANDFQNPSLPQGFVLDAPKAEPSYAGEAGKAFVRGAGQSIGSAGKGLSRLTSDDKRKVDAVEAGIANLLAMTPEEATQFVRSIPEAMDINPVAAVNYQMAARALWKGDKAKAEGYLKTARSLTDTRPLKDQQLYQQSEEFNKSFDTPDWAPAPGWEDAMTVEIFNALGTTAASLPVYIASGPTGVAAFGGAMGTDQQGQSAENELKMFRSGNDATRSNNRAHGRLPSPFVGLSPEDAERLVAREAKLGFLPGASENAPIELLIDQTARRIPGFRTLVNTPFWGQFKRVAGRIILQGMAEGGQEGGQQIASNLISQFMTNPNQKWDEEVAHNALIGAIVGHGMQAVQEVGSAVIPKKAPEATPEAPPPPPGPAPRIEPNVFDQFDARKGPDDDGGGSGGTDASSSVLLQSGYTAEDIADMNPTERDAAVRAVTGEQAVMPAELPRPPIAPPEPAPEVGTAPMAPRKLAPQSTPNPFDQFDEVPQPPQRSEVAATGKRRVGSFEIAGDDVSPEEMFGIGSRKEDRYDQEGEDAHSDVGVNMDEKGNLVDEDGNIVEGGRIEDAPNDWGGSSKAASPSPKPPVRAPIMRRDMEDDSAVTSAGRDVPVKYAVVEASDLVASQLDDGGANPQYPAELQPRDRERAVSQQQVQDIATRLDPRLLDKSPKASDGAPIIADDGTVESGNGRVLAIRRAYKQGGEAAKRYRDHLAAQGYPVGDVREPVLVRVRKGEMAAEDRQAFTREANERDTLGMSATERAMADAAALPDNVTALYRGGDVESAGNREFVRAFIRDVVGKNDQASIISADGAVSQDAIRRIEAALLGKAYGDADLVASLVESPDSNIKAIGGALMDVAPAWAQMRAEAKAGTIDKDADQTERLLEAVRLVQRARREVQPLALLVGQNDIFSGTTLHPTAEFFLSLMFHDTQRWKQPMGREKLAAALQFYVDEERKTSPGADLLGETAAKPNDILALAKRKQENGSQATSTDQAKLDLAQRPRADNGEDAGNASERGTAQAAPRAEATPSPEVAGDGRGKAGLDDAHNVRGSEPVRNPGTDNAGTGSTSEGRADVAGQRGQQTVGTESREAGHSETEGKPDVGLFEEGDEFSSSRNYTPLNSFIPSDKTNLGYRAKEYVLRHGEERGVEVMLVFDSDGNVVADGYGVKNEVGFSPLMAKMMNDGNERLAVHHNHPASRSFSRADIYYLASAGTRIVWAHGHNGKSHRASIADDLRASMPPKTLQNMVGFLYSTAKDIVHPVLQGAINRGDISVEGADQYQAHMISLALHKAGIIDYNSDFRNDFEPQFVTAIDKAAEAVRKHYENSKQFKENPIRNGGRAERLRHIADMGRLSETDSGLAGQRGAEGRTARGSEQGDRPQEDELAENEFPVEPGAEGLPQLVIPGAEKVSAATQTQRLADAKLKPKVAQKGLEVGLFGDESKQYTLLEDESEFAAANFYSGLIRAVEGLKQPKAPASQWMGMIRNAQGVKPEEIAWLGLDEWLSQQEGSITKDALLDFLNANQVRVSEVVKDDTAPVRKFTDVDEAIAFIEKQSGVEPRKEYNFDNDSEYISLANSIASTLTRREGDNQTKFQSYQLPGGENYRELLLTLPVKEQDIDTTGWKVEHTPKGFSPYQVVNAQDEVIGNFEENPHGDADLIERAAKAYEARVGKAQGEYRSGHFSEPNILAHVRFNERTDAEGSKTLFVEEIQSDWHQKGRKQGYFSPPKSFSFDEKTFGQDEHQYFTMSNGKKFPVGKGTVGSEAEAKEYLTRYIASVNKQNQQQAMNYVPDAPFKTSWPELALKRMIRWAAEKGFAKVAWTTGDVQAERYDLSKQISRIEYEPIFDPKDTFEVQAYNLNGKSVLHEDEIPISRVEELLGKEIAEKIQKGQGEQKGPEGSGYRNWKTLSGLDLKVGGEGMIGFYDQILVSVANKLGKKFGAKVGKTQIGNVDKMLYKGPEVIAPYVKSLIDDKAAKSALIERQLISIYHALQNGDSTAKAVEQFGSYDVAEMFQGKLVPSDHEVHSLDITPSMRDSVMQGQALFEEENEFKPSRRQSRTRGMPASRPALAASELAPKVEIPPAPKPLNQPSAKQQEEYAANLEAAKKYEPLPYPSRADAMVAKKLIIKRPRDGVYVTLPAGREHLANYKAQILKEDEDEFKPTQFKRSSPRQGPPAAPTSFEPLHDQPMEAWADDTLRYWGAGQKIDQMVRAAALQKYTTLKDRHVAISRLVEAIERRIGKALPDQMNPFLASRLFAGRMPEAVRVFEETRVKPLVEAMAKRKITPAELGPWLQARHVEERNNHLGQSFDPGDPFYEAMTDPSIIGASGWSQNEADAVLEKVRRSGRSADFKHVADMVYQINDEALAVRLTAGLMDQESYDRIAATYEFYVPHQGFEAEPDNADFIPGIGLGFDLRAPEFRRALGRRSKADNPLAYVVSSAKKGIIRAEKARVDRSMLLVAQTYPNSELYQIDKVETKRVAVVDAEGNTTIQEVRDRGADQADNVLVVKIGGKARRITFTEGKGDRLARAFKNLEVPQLGPFVRFMHTLNRMWAQLNTSRSPEFLTKNFHIDSITALININVEGKAKAALSMVRTVGRAMRGMNRHLKGKHDTAWANHAADYAAHGGKMEYLGLIGIENEKKMFERLYRQQTERVPMTKKALWDATLGRLERWNDALENAWRLSAYVALVKHGISKDRAAQAARDLTVDFSVHGEYGPNINAFYAFFNATAEGQINIVKRYVYNKHTRRVFNGLILLGFTQTLLNYWIADDDDDGEDRYAKIPDFVKLNNFIFMVPSWVPEKYKPKAGYYTYPARGWNIFHVIGQMAAETVAGDRSPTEATSIIATSLVNFANPMGNSGLSLNTLAPTMLDPIVDVATNTNYMGSEIVPGAGKYDKRPQSERYRNTTSEFFVYPAKKLNELTGGSDERSGTIDVSPEVLEHWYEFVTGGIGRLSSRSWNTIENIAAGADIDPEKLPFARLYLGQDQSFENRNLYYKIKDAVETTERELKAREEEGDFKAAELVAKKYWRETQIIEDVNEVEKALADLRKEKREMQKNLDVDEATRRAVIKDIDAQIDAQMLDIRRLWNTLRKQKVAE